MDIKNPDQIIALKDNPAEIKRLYGHLNWIPVGVDSRARRLGKESSYRNYKNPDPSNLAINAFNLAFYIFTNQNDFQY